MTDGIKDKNLTREIVGSLLARSLAAAAAEYRQENNTFFEKILLDIIASEMFDADERELTYGEQLVGYDPDKKYDPALKEMLLDFATAIDILDNCKGTTPRAIRATETAIGHIQTACFWAQNAMAGSKL